MMRKTVFAVSAVFIALCGVLAAGEAEYNFPEDVSKIYDPATKSIMEIPTTAEAINAFIKEFPDQKYFVFGQDRLNPIRRSDLVPAHWIKYSITHQQGRFTGQAQPGEFFVFQLGVFAAKEPVENIRLSFSALKNARGDVISPDKIRCLNLGGIGPDGKAFSKRVDVARGKVQAMWIGIEIDKRCKGLYKGHIRVVCDNLHEIIAAVEISVDGEVIVDSGDREAWRLSRLRWLDSKISQDTDNIVKPFDKVKLKGKTISILGREIVLCDNGLPKQIRSYFSGSNTKITNTAEKILSSPITFIVELEDGTTISPGGEYRIINESNGRIEWEVKGQNTQIKLRCIGATEPDGYVRYGLDIEAKQELKVKDVRLEIPLRKENAEYMMGLGYQGGLRPDEFSWKWDVTKHQDCLWIGKVNAGMQIKLKGANYNRPLVNIYYDFNPLNLPESWGNEGKGTVTVKELSSDSVMFTASSGERTLQKGRKLSFDFDMYITPFKPVNQKEQWSTRYIHPHQGINDPHFKNPDMVVDKGANTVNMHHNMDFNPFINYPYNDLSFANLIDCIKAFHNKGLKLKLYYTTREVTNNMPELFAFHSLDGEVIFPGPGNDAKTLIHRNGPHGWLKEHLREKYIPAWTETIRGRYGNRLDLAVITTPDTRWNNFYLEGLDWLIQKADIDGLYIDDTALDRRSLMRARRILDRDKAGRLIDLHSWNHYNGWAKYASCANLYMEIFPYIDRIWFGEGFNYNNTTPEYWLTEISGIPYGLMGEMLQGGGNPWLGMVYGMTQRLGWSGDPRGLWKFWDEFGMDRTEMIGYWDPACPVTCDNKDVRITVYKHEDGRLLAAIGNWSKTDVRIKLLGHRDRTGLKKGKTSVIAPKIDNFQEKAVFDMNSEISVKAKQGWLLVLESK